MLKQVVLKIICKNAPANLKIFSSNNILIKQTTLSDYFSWVCLKTYSSYVVLKITQNNQTTTKYVGLFKSPCQTRKVVLNFSQNVVNLKNFFLVDKNYGFNISSAVLKFLN